MGKASSVFGVVAIGFGTLLLWSAFTGLPLFGTGGLIRTFITTGSVDGNAFALGELAGKGAVKGAEGLAQKYFGASTPPNNPPPGSAKALDA